MSVNDVYYYPTPIHIAELNGTLRIRVNFCSNTRISSPVDRMTGNTEQLERTIRVHTYVNDR